MAAFEIRDFSDRQLQVLSWWRQESPVRGRSGIIADGAIRSGKTLSMSFSFVLWAMANYDGQSFGMCGKTIASFHRNVYTTLSALLSTLSDCKIERHRSDNLFVVRYAGRENRFYIFGGKDEGSQDLIQGITLAGVFFDEVALMPESFVNQATGRCSVDGSTMWFNCNPANPSHWFRQNWIQKAEEKGLLYLHFTMEDNLTLSPEIKARYASMYSGVFYQRYILGLWVLAEGLVYPMFDREKHVKHLEKWERDRRKKYYLTVDYGTVNPFAALLIEYDPATRKSLVLKEIYYKGRGGHRVDNEAYYKMILDTVGLLPLECIIIDPSAAAMIETIKKYRRFTVKGANNDVLNGIVEVTKHINKGLIEVADTCKNTLDEFGSYAWDDDPVTERVIKENDHAMDALRYYVMTAMRAAHRWEV